ATGAEIYTTGLETQGWVRRPVALPYLAIQGKLIIQGWVERSETHQIHAATMGIACGSTHPTACLPSSFHFQIKRVREDEAQTVLWHGKRSRQSNRLIWKWNQSSLISTAV
ncbi:MAG: hypothetical protein LBE62_05345, partial [Azonexus sp.]|nr:hypothetical protein [Azonexus sp.]